MKFGIGIDGSLEELDQVIQLGAHGVLGGYLDIREPLFAEFHGLDHLVDDLLFAHLELVLAVDGAGGNKGVQTFVRAGIQRLGDRLDITQVADQRLRRITRIVRFAPRNNLGSGSIPSWVRKTSATARPCRSMN